MTTPNPFAVISNKARHTPGPWVWDGACLDPVDRDPNTSDVYNILTRDTESGGHGYCGSHFADTIAENQANARLIAAAPQLLDAAKAAAAVLWRHHWEQDPTDPQVIAVAKLFDAIFAAVGEQE